MKTIDPQEVQARLEAGEQLNIIDVREADEVAGGKIPQAIHIPLGLVEFKMNELDKNKEYLVVCHAGGRSARAVQFLESQGYNATNVDGGMLAWEGETE
ncbi:rhodanese [Pradoshia eiseniae]|uniref:Rhodanese n=1 Tax=Pradoshia eiseniae TaxID=2064768 RepID=A0A2S7MVP4_9BACI|nr:rhodanese-like domain-containing protein [Pradoshia eiseniae]PQD93820.1 rhodanese [Pradoshia eiseniae]